MPNHYTIGELARAVEVPTSTLRYYERIGLLRPAGRTRGNYRYYNDDAFERVAFIRAAQATGFRLEDVQTLMALRDGDTAPCREVQELIEERLADAANRMKDLRRVQRVLQSSLDACREAEDSGRCEVLTTLSNNTSRPRKKKS